MHGRPRNVTKPEDAEVSAAKASKLRMLQSELLYNHENHIYDKEALYLSAQLLELNPEFSIGWNYRKLAVNYMLGHSSSEPESVKSILDEELRVVISALKWNFKCYGAWFHRKWVINKGHCSLDSELQLLDRFQKADSRNFHAWSYRRYIAEKKDIRDEEELKFTTEMIDNNFSNYSAWHNRSFLLSKLWKKKTEGFFPKVKVLEEEFDLVHQALFTDPDDQSGWFYYNWLLSETLKQMVPRLLSSWPHHSTDVIMSEDGYFELEGNHPSPSTCFRSATGTLPIILFFSMPVEGVDSCTVVVVTEFSIINNDLIWKPLSTTKAAQAWMTQLKLPIHYSKTCKVDVIVGHSDGVISLHGIRYGPIQRLSFTVSIRPYGQRYTDQHDMQMVLWKDENFNSLGIKSQELIQFAGFDNLGIDHEEETAVPKWCQELLANETDIFRQLLSEIDCKIGMLTLARLLEAQNMVSSIFPNSYNADYFDETLELYNNLIKLDPIHAQFYKDEHSLILLQQLASSWDCLLGKCCLYSLLASSAIGNLFCLRLNNMSLSRFGSAAQFLWVQVLDLRHNELHLLEGLEMLQLLCFLNVSHNKITSFTALAPLKHLKLLRVLDVSYNEIGSHSIDTTRYLCPSPLSHSAALLEDEVENNWEAWLFFKDMDLRQLDVVGNAICCENFKSLLVRAQPRLKWLDGQNL